MRSGGTNVRSRFATVAFPNQTLAHRAQLHGSGQIAWLSYSATLQRYFPALQASSELREEHLGN